jgi:hypothetical protein
MGNSIDDRFRAVPMARHEEGAYFPQERRGPRMDNSIVLDADPSALAASGSFCCMRYQGSDARNAQANQWQ